LGEYGEDLPRKELAGQFRIDDDEQTIEALLSKAQQHQLPHLEYEYISTQYKMLAQRGVQQSLRRRTFPPT
jgi:hypothetical protein